MSVPYPSAPPVRPRFAALGSSVSSLLEAGCFWTAVVLPLSYPVILGVDAVAPRGDALLALLGLHLLALLGGREYRVGSTED